MPKIVTALLCFIIIFNVNGQIQSIPGYPEMHVDLFHAHLIKDNAISEIKAEYAYKYDRKNLHFTQKEAHYSFNSDGLLIKKTERKQYHSSKDKVLDLYFYDAEDIQDLRAPPGNRLEKLTGNREDQYSVRINDQWRLCFDWADDKAHNVEIVDYHS